MKALEEDWRRGGRKFYGESQPALTPASATPIKPVYSPADMEGLDYSQDLGMPGLYPYTRGAYPLLYQSSPWTTQQGMGYGLPEETRQRYDLLLREGLEVHQGMVPPFFMVPDAPSQE